MPVPVTKACSDEASPPLTPAAPAARSNTGRHQHRPLPVPSPPDPTPSPHAPASAVAPYPDRDLLPGHRPHRCRGLIFSGTGSTPGHTPPPLAPTLAPAASPASSHLAWVRSCVGNLAALATADPLEDRTPGGLRGALLSTFGVLPPACAHARNGGSDIIGQSPALGRGPGACHPDRRVRGSGQGSLGAPGILGCGGVGRSVAGSGGGAGWGGAKAVAVGPAASPDKEGVAAGADEEGVVAGAAGAGRGSPTGCLASRMVWAAS